ncbi:MAG: tetratricopeptide repeat protein [Alphaproteobacteria bacterium]|nr:tetratricopeptide repeat protein [Alphaproteobacteria bacterium]
MDLARTLRLCCLLGTMVIVCPPAWAQTATAAFDDAEAQLRIRQAATAASAAARESDTLRKALEAERKRVVQTDGERDLNQAAIRALEKDLQAAEARQREQEATLTAAQDSRTRGLALRPQGGPVTTPVATTVLAPPQNYAELRRWCFDLRGTDDRHVMQGCDAVILSSRESPQDHAVAFFNRGFAHKNRGLHDRAIEDYGQAIRLMPSMGLAYNGRGLAFALKGLHERAMLDFAEAIRLMPDADFAFANRATAALKLGQLESAITDYGAALRIDPRNAGTLYRRGVARRQKGDVTGGDADIAAARAIQGDIADYFGR